MIALLADIHGNWPALRAVLTDADAKGCERIVCLGDVAGYYCMVDACADELRRRGACVTLGNHDHYLASGTSCPRSKSANVCLDYQRQHVTDETLAWLRGLPLSWEEGDAMGVHGGWHDAMDEYVEDVGEGYFTGLGHRFYFSGHTHRQRLDMMKSCIYCNPGSVGQPRDGDARAAYAIWTGREVRMRRVAYDIEAIASAMRAVGFDAYYTVGLYSGDRIGGNSAYDGMESRAGANAQEGPKR